MKPIEICKELKIKVKSKAQLLQYLITGADLDYNHWKEGVGIKSATAFTDKKLDELINAYYEIYKKYQENSKPF